MKDSFKATTARYTLVDQVNAQDLQRWLKKARDIQGDDKNIVRRKGQLVGSIEVYRTTLLQHFAIPNQMNIQLTLFLARFVEYMNSHDSASFITCFAPESVVEDEDHIHRGMAEIKMWIDESFAKYSLCLMSFQ